MSNLESIPCISLLTPSPSEKGSFEERKNDENDVFNTHNNLLIAVDDVLNQINYWHEFKKQCDEYKTMYRTGLLLDSYRFEVCVELSHIIDVYPKLGELIFHDFSNAVSYFKDVLYNKQNYWSLMDPLLISRDQFYIVLKVSGFDLQMPLAEELWKCKSPCNELIFFEGLIHSICPSVKYTQSTRFVCGLLSCPNHGTPYFIRVHYSFHDGNQDISMQKHFCVYCKSRMIEDKSKRLYGERIRVVIKGTDPLKKSGDIDRSILISIRDESRDHLKLGGKYIFSGILVNYYKKGCYLSVFEISHFKKMHKYNLFPLSPKNYNVIRKIYTELCGSSWQFLFFMARQFALQVLPGNMFFGIKLLVMLSLAQNGFSDEEDGMLSVCFTGSNVVQVNNLLKFAAEYYPYYIHYSSHHDCVPCKNLVSEVITGGTMQWAHHVYIIGNLEICNLSKHETSTLINSLENEMFLVNSNHEFLNTNTEVIWASLEQKSDFALNNSNVKFFTCEKPKLNKLVNVFDLIISVNAWETEDAQKTLAEWSLQKAREVESSNYFSGDQWIEYFNATRRWNVTMNAEVSSFIQKYIVKRRAFSGKNQTLVSFPVSLTKTLIKLSIAVGKLCFTTNIQYGHALIAIILVEENLLTRTGCTPFKNLLLKNLPMKVMPIFYEPVTDQEMIKIQNEVLNFVNSVETIDL